MAETRETVERLKQELQEVRAASGAQGAETAASSKTPHSSSTVALDPKPALKGRARGRAARSAAGGGGSGQLSINLAELGLQETDRSVLAAAVQTTRSIIEVHG